MLEFEKLDLEPGELTFAEEEIALETTTMGDCAASLASLSSAPTGDTTDCALACPSNSLPTQLTTTSIAEQNPSSLLVQQQVPALTWPKNSELDLDWIENLISIFDWSSKNLPPSEFPLVLPVQAFDTRILTASKILHKEPSCITIDPVESSWLLSVFMPDRVFLLRGNHESKYCTSNYGFEKEVLTKYGDSGKHVYRKCLGCFEELPLASIIAGCVYTAHGGLFRSIPLVPSKRSKRTKRHRVSFNSEPNSLSLDPSMTPGLSLNKERGIGLLWGPDCTENFLKKFNLKLIIRSHEGPDAREKWTGFGGMDEGYTIDHVVESGKLITVFSAPDYPQFQVGEERYKNKGAYVVLEPPNFDNPKFYSFEAVAPRPQM
ncbi:hypothetical protein CMV_023668 [Castanea mollissima]|uniref:Serine/threonine-protein phosphatase n=1 Tax=Castanea mollissima TaxID=60419 RepID=A0A8J4QJ44_9ROSI|nr:hypothetical protein CMV_023668 [Castanea mollissima]